MSTFIRIITSRKVLLALVAILQAVVLQYLDVPAVVWQAASGFLGLLIAWVAFDDLAWGKDYPREIRQKFEAMLHAPAFWSALVGYAVTIVAYYVKLSPELWTTIDVLIAAVIAGAIVESRAK